MKNHDEILELRGRHGFAPGDSVKIIEWPTKDQLRKGDDPKGRLRINEIYVVEEMDEHSWHTLVKIVGVDDCLFNSVMFSPIEK
jgi:hypothetical protein